MSGASISSPLSLHSSWVTDISISSDCSTLLTAGDRLVWWSLPAPPLAPPSGHQEESLTPHPEIQALKRQQVRIDQTYFQRS